MPIKPKYDTGFKYGTSVKYGFGTSEPWKPADGADRFNVESLADPAMSTTPETSASPSFTPDSSATPTYTPDSP